MAARPTQTDQPTTALDLLERYADSPTYRALPVEQQCHIQEALQHLAQYEAAAPMTRPSQIDTPQLDAFADGVRAAERGEFTTDVDVN